MNVSRKGALLGANGAEQLCLAGWCSFPSNATSPANIAIIIRRKCHPRSPFCNHFSIPVSLPLRISV